VLREQRGVNIYGTRGEEGEKPGTEYFTVGKYGQKIWFQFRNGFPGFRTQIFKLKHRNSASAAVIAVDAGGEKRFLDRGKGRFAPPAPFPVGIGQNTAEFVRGFKNGDEGRNGYFRGSGK
jgi:hypothetical protein